MAKTVLKQGNLGRATRDRIFNCGFCGCRFIAPFEDYTPVSLGYGANWPWGDLEMAVLSQKAAEGIAAFSECPACGAVAYSETGPDGFVPGAPDGPGFGS